MKLKRGWRSSHCGAKQLAVSWGCWDTGSIPGLAQWVKDLVLPQLWLGSDSWPGTPYATRWPKKKKKRERLEKNKEVPHPMCHDKPGPGPVF